MHLKPVITIGSVYGMDYPKNQLEFEKLFATEEMCQAFLWKLRHPDGYLCPNCGHKEYWPQTRSRRTCKSCKYELSILKGTIFSASHLPLSVWFRACWWFTNQKQGVSALGLQKALGIGSYRTSWLVLHKLRRAMISPGRNLLSGEVEVDEIYIGGDDKPGAKYRSSKRLVLIAAEKSGKGIGRIRMTAISSTSSDALLRGVEQMVQAGCRIETDAWRGYLRLSDKGYIHDRTEMATTRPGKREADALPRVHRVASLFKRWVLGTYQGSIDSKHLQQYLDEFVFRFNRRTSGSRGLLFLRLLENAISVKSSTYQDITRKHQ